jgi:acylphosphatase
MDMMQGQQPMQGQPMQQSAPDLGRAAAISWEDGSVTVMAAGQTRQVESIGDALQMVLEAYQRTSAKQSGQADFLQGFSEDESGAAEREPTESQRAGARRY